ncbi:hypothetical protein M427DRAFT_33793 [Gonapodya prolifera JEL478]|uniref:Uncharacterized protein n=1 Tax=Gonapodya prolifera (strain JEL478) TaxID=1344416 RepID=A0A139AAB9_GONPJ|nr:hypothetical protein M427DRAFT_33793 [Gonapodya prolifera JEL478]|eukprot:KXS13604.1 hypothetical protein M427DRAFT_33793 [Gonapodya prolifera JEL478]
MSDPSPQWQSDAADITQLFSRLAFLESVVGSSYAPHSALVVPPDPLLGDSDPRSDQADGPDDVDDAHGSRSVSVLEKILIVRRFLNHELQRRKVVGELVRLYTSLRPILDPDPLTNPTAASSSASSVADSLPTSVKAELVLAAAEDLERAAHWIEGVEVEKDILEQDVSSKPPPDISPLEVSHLSAVEQLDILRDRTSLIVQGYADLVNSLNELFVFYHATLEEAEREVAHAERRQRKEQEG